MKRANHFFLTIIIQIIFSTTVVPQLLNGSFEQWDLMGNPDNWITAEFPGFPDAISQSTDAQDGMYSVKIEVMDYSGEPYSGNLQSIDSTNLLGHTIQNKYVNVSGYYKFLPKGSAEILIIASVFNESSMLVGVGGLDIYNSQESWSEFNFPIEYFIDTDPNSIVISISIVDTASAGFDPNTIGSIALIDNLSLNGVTNICENPELPVQFSLSQNYPNPFNPTTTIKYSIPSEMKSKTASVKILIYDILGREIVTLVNQNHKPGTYEVEWNAINYPSGIYYYKLNAGDFVETKKMIFLK